jgi:hypothetical protein
MGACPARRNGRLVYEPTLEVCRGAPARRAEPRGALGSLQRGPGPSPVLLDARSSGGGASRVRP